MTHILSKPYPICPHLTRDQAETMALVAPETRVVHVNDRVEGAVYIGRANRWNGLQRSKWANPHKIGDWASDAYGDLSEIDRTEAVLRYSYDLVVGTLRCLLTDLPELRGKPIACWCRHDGEERTEANACHGDVLKDLLDQYTDDELRAMAVPS